jgi:DhnA family fructose-bisphosphate aldolase class Ia
MEFIFMLTHNDSTVAGGLAVYREVRATGLRYVGFKDVGATVAELGEITRAAHDDGIEVMLEVVSTSRDDELRSLRAAPEIGVDWVLGGTHADEGVAVLEGSGLRYCPFPGRIVGHPSELRGTIAEIAGHAHALTAIPGVHGLDLLAYRHRSEDPVALTRAVVAAASGPVIAAGSVTSAQQITALAEAGAWGFTIGGAIFEGRLPGGPDVAAQVRGVLAVAAGPTADERR